MHLQAKQSISPNNSPSVSQALGAGKYMIMVKGPGKKAWRWRGLRGVLVRVPGTAVPSPRLDTGCPQGWGWLPEVSTTLIRVIQGKGPNPPGMVMPPGYAPCPALPQPPSYHINWEK